MLCAWYLKWIYIKKYYEDISIENGWLSLIHITWYHCMFQTSHNLCKLISSLSSQLFQQMYRFRLVNSILLIYTLYFLLEYTYIIELVCETHQVWPLSHISWKINLHCIYTIQKRYSLPSTQNTSIKQYWIYTSKTVHCLYMVCVAKYIQLINTPIHVFIPA